ncbi:hypothetical protein Mapa_004698 [Marchantia paleacea]|nr:hypothetical protein Mapa_004698 [Marchantia paleacea]
MDMEGVQGVLIDEKLLFKAGKVLHFQPDAHQLLCRLQYSKLCLGLLQREDDYDVGSNKEFLLRDIGVAETLRYVRLLPNSSPTEALMTAGWVVPFTSSVYITGHHHQRVEGDLSSQGWTVIRVAAQPFAGLGTGDTDGSLPTVEQLYEIPAALAVLNKRALTDRIVVVGYTMKWSRELEFLKRGALPMLRNRYGLSFIALQLNEPLEKQLLAVDVILHKATDEIVSVNPGQFGTLASIEFSQGIQNLQSYLQEHAQICVVDPIERILPLLDRVSTQAILKDMKIPAQQIIRPPRSVEVTSFDEPLLSQALGSENVVLPTIVKPRIACGASESHSMAIVFDLNGFRGLPVPLPATIQEYVDHGAFQYKMYVVGSKLLYSRRKSTPNASRLAAGNDGSPVILFDSLKSLPVEPDMEIPGGQMVAEDSSEFDIEAVQMAASWLRKKLGLTIIGFDIVVQAGTKDYVIVDVNYFPSFKDVADEEAIPAFWEALLTAHSQWSRSR